MILGDIIKQYRKKHHYSMEAFAKLSGISRSYVAILEKNLNPVNNKPIIPSLETIKAVSKVVGIDFNDVIAMLGYRLSYTIKENISSYHEAFKTTNNPKNKGDVTPFVLAFLTMIEQSMKNLHYGLAKRMTALMRFQSFIPQLPHGDNKQYEALYNLLIQASLFAEHGISMHELEQNLKAVRTTISKRLNILKDMQLIAIKSVDKKKYYALKLDVAEQLVQS